MPPSEQARKYLEKANELAHRQQFNAAFAQFELAIRRQYGYSKAHADFGSALLEAGKYPEAIEQFRKAIEFNPAERLVVHAMAGRSLWFRRLKLVLRVLGLAALCVGAH